MNNFGTLAVLALASMQTLAADCAIQQLAELPVTMERTRPIVAGSINGREAKFLVDSGAHFSMLGRESVAKFQLRLFPLPGNMRIRGVGGTTDGQAARISQLTVDGIRGAISNVDFIVGGNSMTFRDFDGLLGQNIVGTHDTEFDLANGHIRLMKSDGCRKESLAYWAGNNPVAVMEIERRTPAAPHLIGDATINGKKIRVMFDSGAWRSILSKKAAERAGMTLDHEEMSAAGLSSGVGKRAIETSIARFDILDLGGEQIKNARLFVGDVGNLGRDMLLGADFFLSHRIYVAGKQNKIYFTYNGGPVFDLRRGAQSQDIVSEASDEMDAQDFLRRGAASAGRRDFASAIADFDRAIELEPTNADAIYQRGLAKRDNRQGRQAMDDFNQALTLQPDHSGALMARGQLHLAMNSVGKAAADFGKLEALSPNDAGVALLIAQSYSAMRHYDEAVKRYDRWLTQFPKSDRVPAVHADRCLARALLGQDLEQARADCDLAIKRGGRNSQYLQFRGLVWLRLDNAKEASEDFSAALKLQPKAAVSLYGLGLAEKRLGRTDASEQLLADATKIQPGIAEYFKRMNLAP